MQEVQSIGKRTRNAYGEFSLLEELQVATRKKVRHNGKVVNYKEDSVSYDNDEDDKRKNKQF